MWPLYLCIAALFLYKVLDRLIRVPMTSAPTSKKDYILITGCDSGFGNLFAKRLDGKGFHVFAACLTERGKTDLENASSARLKAFVMNITDQESVNNGYRYVASSLPEGVALWAVVNNAGIGSGRHCGRPDWLNNDDFAEVMGVNLYGMISVNNAFLPLLKKNKGRIVNMASFMGRVGFGLATYAASKFAVEGYSDCLRRDLRVWGISVHIIEPGYFATPLTNPTQYVHRIRQTWKRLPADVQNEYGEEYLELTIKEVEENLQKVVSPKLHLVVDAYEHAVLGKFPRARYVVGDDVNFFFWPLSFLPEWLSDWILMRKAPLPRGFN